MLFGESDAQDGMPGVAFFLRGMPDQRDVILMHDCLVSFGSNVGDGRKYFAAAAAALRNETDSSSFVFSDLITTRPVGGPDGQDKYINGCIRFQTAHSPAELMRHLHGIEAGLGRQRREQWGPRTVDLDLLLVGTMELETQHLSIPHPRMSFRRFVLQPADQIAADMLHPTSGCTIGGLLNQLKTKPNRILWLADEALYRETFAAIGLRFKRESWEIQRVCDETAAARAIDDTKLLVIVGDQPAKKVKPAPQFRGPMLKLDRVDPEIVALELVASIQSMTGI